MGEIFDELGAMAVALGILMFALFPFAIPMILLVVVPLVPLGIVGALLALPVLLVRRR